ncbi:hypothetical protein TWF481_002072 [Arthrobotrys musiformis]|uniref:Uncharacterized protein n=1 Tax=Arthrobotrys musiformis TaxID=47236 RepID=A0AAV9VS39_9PEZI
MPRAACQSPIYWQPGPLSLLSHMSPYLLVHAFKEGAPSWIEQCRKSLKYSYPDRNFETSPRRREDILEESVVIRRIRSLNPKTTI